MYKSNFSLHFILQSCLLGLALLFFFLPIKLFCQIEFDPDPIRSFPTISAVYSMTSADFNGDGLIDLAATNYFSDGSLVTIHLNNSSASGLFLSEPYVINLPCNMYDLKSADFNLDGKPDLVIDTFDSIVILENQSTIASLDFFEHNILTGDAYNRPFLVSDFNNDGKIDLVVSGNRDSIYVFENISSLLNMQFQKVATLHVPDFSCNFSNLTTGDFNSDTRMDIAVATSWQIFVLSNTSSTEQISFAEPVRVNPATATGPFGAGDLDDDGKVDLICSGVGDDVVFLKNRSTQGAIDFERAGSIETDGAIVRSITIANLNYDSKPEIIIHTCYSWFFTNASTHDYIEIFQNNSTSARYVFEGKKYGVAWDPSFIIANDLDNDGSIDIAASSYQGSSISLMHNLGNGSISNFDSSYKLPVEYWPWTIHTSDLNNDAKPDLISANWGSRTLSIYKNNSVVGNLEFYQPLVVNMGYHPPEYESPYTSSCDFSIADFNGDGLNDLAVAHMTPTYISLFQNISSLENLSFTAPDTIMLKYRSDKIFSADLNNDNKMDLIVSDGILLNSSSNDRIKFEKSKGIGGSSILPHAVADFDGDSKVDILNGSRFYLNESSINELKFVPLQYNLGEVVKYAKTDDFNGDGRPDLMLTNTSGRVLVYLNFSTPGNLVFSESKEYRPLREARAVASKDLTGDGMPEIVVNNQDYNVAILENNCSNGEINFQPAFPGYVVVGNSQSLAIEDLDGDACPEIISTRSYSNQVVIVSTKSSAPPSPFTLLAPANGDTVFTTSPAATWTDATNPNFGNGISYTLYYSVDSSFLTADTISNISTTSYPFQNLQDHVRYYWKVEATNKNGGKTISEVFCFFTLAAPMPFGLISPAQGSKVIGDSLHFTWNAAYDPNPADTILYELLVDSSKTFNNPISAPPTTKTCLSIKNDFKESATNYWTIKAYDASENVTAASDTFAFQVRTSSVNAWDKFPQAYSLEQNYPNPFNPSTIIKYQLPYKSLVFVSIFDVLGHTVRTLIKEEQQPGYYSLLWDGKDSYGNLVGSGAYFYQIKADKFIQTRKLLLIR